MSGGARTSPRRGLVRAPPDVDVADVDDDRVDDVDVDVEVEGAGSKSSTRISQAPAFVSPSTLPRGTSHRDAPISTRMQSICELLESAAMHYCPQVRRWYTQRRRDCRLHPVSCKPHPISL